MKKLINILVFILLIGSFSDLSSQTYTRIGENNTQYTADQSTNHIFTMVKDGTYDPITINVSLNKVTFKNTSTNTNYGWGTGNDIPAAWDFEILTVSKTPSSISGDKHSFTYSGVPIVDVAITVRVFDGDGTVTGLAEVPITYRLEGIFALSSAEFIACSESLQIVMNEVDLGNNVKPCAGTSGDPKYNIKIYDAGTTDLVVEVTQLSNEFLIPLDVGDYDYVITDGCGRTFTSSYDITDAPEIGAEVIFAGKECFGDTDTKIVLRVQGAKRPLTWVLEKKNGDNWDPVYTSGNVGGNASSSADITAIGTGIFTLTVTGLIADGVYKYTFTDANECTKSTEFNIVTPSALSHLLIESDSATKRVLNCSGDVDGKLTFRGSGGWTQPFDGNFINPTNWGSGYTFTLVNADTGGDVAVVNASTWFDYARNDSNQQIGWEAVFDNLPPGNYKLKLKESVATDNQVDPNVAYGCEVLFDDIYTISAPALLVVTTDAKNDISCFGDNNGSIDLLVSGGTPTYTYAWTKVGDASYSATTKDVNGLSPGTYNVEVKDSKDCIITKTYTIVEPVLLEVSIDNPSAISCYGNNVGTIKANITQGSTSPYVYVLTGTDYNGGNVTVTSASTAATSYEFTGLLAGTEYKVTITDSNGCSKVTDAKIITQPDSGLTVTGTVKADVEKTINGDGIHMLCNGGTNGEIDLTVSGGNSPYNFAWTAVSGTGLNATAEDQTGLTAGVYNVTVTDSSGDCSVSRTYIVSDPAPLTIPVVDIPDGTPGFTLIGEFETSKYYLSNASLTYMEARDIAANLGGYLVSIKTQLENQWLIDNSPDQNFWLGLDDIRDESKVDGVVDKTKYRWNDGTSLDWQGFPGSEPNDAGKNTTTNFAGEDYIEFSDGSWNDIYHYVKRKFVIEFNPSQIPDFNGSSISCFGGNNASIDFVVTGGTTDYTYNWTVVSGGTGTNLVANQKSQTLLTAGVYKVVVTDASGCTISTTYTITEPSELLIADATVSTAIACFGDNETIKVNVTQGSTAPYIYSISGSATETSAATTATTYSFSVPVGTYTVKVTDANGCEKSLDPITLTQSAAALAVSGVVKPYIGGFQVSCNGASDGEIDTTVTGGTIGSGYTYAWSVTVGGTDISASTSADQLDLKAGTYTVVVTDANGCTQTDSYTLTEPDVLAVSGVVKQYIGGIQVSCNGANDGEIDTTVAGGATDYTYAWSVTGGGTDISASTSADQLDLKAGTYTVVVTDANGCTETDSYTITEPSELLIADATVSTAIACFGDNETIKVNVTQGSTAPYIYSISGSATETSAATTATTYSFSVPVGTYTVKVTDANGCEKSLDPITLTQSAAALAVSGVVKPYIGGFQVSCNGASDGEIDTTVTGGTIGSGYTYAWSVTVGGTDISASTSADQLDLKAGTYTVVVTDANGCTQTDSYTLTEPDVLAVSGVVKQYIGGIQVSCNGANDGEIDTTVAGGATDYTYAWSVTGGGTDISASTSADQLDLKAGTYTVVVTDANGCTQTDSYTLTQPDALSLDSSQVDFNGFNVSCFGALNGEIDLTVTGGTPVYTYEWSSSDGTGYDPTSQDQTDLSSGTYIVKVTDSNNCEISGTFVVAEPPPLVLTATLSDFNGFNISCNAGNDGIIDITSTGGLLVTGDNYTYAWTQSNGGSGVDASSEDQTGLTVGTYTVLITDSNDCTITKSYQIVEPDLIGFTGVKSDYNGYGISTAGNNNGTITITSSGGSGGNTYDWSTDDGSGIVVGDQNQNTLTAGTYILKITDSNGCNITKSFTLTEPAELLISLGTDPTNILCYGDSTGLIKAIITQAAVPPYTFTLNGENYLGEIVFESFSNITDLNYTFNVKAGEYSITVTDLNGSTKTTNTRVYTQPDAPLSISETISVFNDYNISCTGALDGAIDITVSGGTLTGTNYTYSWTSSVGSSDLTGTRTAEDQTGLGTGEYTVIVTDEGDCTITKSFVLTEPEKIVYSLNNKTDITCFGDNDGSIEISVSKGTGAYVYEWTLEGVVVNKNDTTSLKNLGPGVYNLKLTDGCEILSFNYKIVEPELLTVNLDQKIDILCFGDSTGEISVTVAGGISPYNYEWIDNFGNKYNRDIGNVFNKGDLSNIPIGIYDLTVTDKNGCIATLKTELTQPDDLVINFDKIDLNCYEQNDGTIKITPTGGVAPYTYKWSDFGNGPERTNLSAGIYTVNVTDKNLCEKTIDIEIIQAPLFNIVPVITPVTCFGADDGTITLNIDGGEDPISVTWADDATAGDSRTNLKPGNYNVILNDGSGCVIERTFQILEPEELRLSSVLSDAIDCDNPLSGSIDLQVIGGNPPYSFLWSNGETTEDLTDIGANNYKVTVTDSKGCKVVETFVIKRQLDLEVKLDTSLRIVCESREVYQVNKLTISGGVFPYKVKWSDGIVLNVPGDKAEIMETKTEGAYQVEVTDFLGCTKTILFDVAVPKLGYPDFDYTSFYLQEFNALTFNDPITFSNLSTENFLSVEWDFGDGTTSSLNNPTHTYTETGSYDVTIYVTYVGGCVYELTKTIYIGESYELELPNAFTPNGDGLNDTFRPVYYGFTEIVLKVFDTWGTLIYFEKAEKGKMNGWNGTINTRPAENGNYIYQVSGKTFNGELVYKNGPFTLLR